MSRWVWALVVLGAWIAGWALTKGTDTLVVAALFGWQEIRAALTPSSVSQFAHLLGGACGLLYGLLGSGQRTPAGTAPAPAATPVP